MAFLSELPESLVIKILISLPVKDLMQCRCVDKSWYNLVTDPYFIWSHLCQSADERGYFVTALQSRLYMEEYFSFSCDETFLKKLKVKHTYSELIWSLKPVDCAKGLLLMLNTNALGSELYLWNPALQKFKPLPCAQRNSFNVRAFGFAFLPEICDYRVIRILDYFSELSGVAEVYSLKTYSWRRIETPFMRLTHCHTGPSLAVFVNPFFYWTETTFQDNHWTECLVSFDIKCETFKMAGLPAPCLEDGSLNGFLAVFQESLCLFACQDGIGWSLWMMKENSSSGVYWSKICLFGYPDRCPVGFMKNGDVIMEDGKDKVSIHDPRNVSSSPKMSECEMDWELRCSNVYNYSPSLALLNQRSRGN